MVTTRASRTSSEGVTVRRVMGQAYGVASLDGMAFHDPNTWSAPGKWTSVTAAGVVVLSFEGTIVRLLDLSQWTILLVRGPLMAVGLGVIFWLGWGRGGGHG